MTSTVRVGSAHGRRRGLCAQVVGDGSQSCANPAALHSHVPEIGVAAGYYDRREPATTAFAIDTILLAAANAAAASLATMGSGSYCARFLSGMSLRNCVAARFPSAPPTFSRCSAAPECSPFQTRPPRAAAIASAARIPAVTALPVAATRLSWLSECSAARRNSNDFPR